jgi:hypothetical protein
MAQDFLDYQYIAESLSSEQIEQKLTWPAQTQALTTNKQTLAAATFVCCTRYESQPLQRDLSTTFCMTGMHGVVVYAAVTMSMPTSAHMSSGEE